MLKIAEQYITLLLLLSEAGPDVRLVLGKDKSEKGYSRSHYTPSLAPSTPIVWMTEAEVRAEYDAGVERVRPLMVALGCAETLRDSSRWHAPSLEVWASIEKVTPTRCKHNSYTTHATYCACYANRR